MIVGHNIPILRQKAGMSQIELAHSVGVSAQQIHKYEKAITGVGASRLAQIASALGVAPVSLFEGVHETCTAGIAGRQQLFAVLNGIKLAKAFAEIDDSVIRRTIVELTTDIARTVKATSK